MPCAEAGRKDRGASRVQAVDQVSCHRQQHPEPYIIADQGQSTVHLGGHDLLLAMEDIDRCTYLGHPICEDSWERFRYNIFTPRTRRVVDRPTHQMIQTVIGSVGHLPESVPQIDTGLRCRWGHIGPDKESDQHPPEQSEVAIPRYRKCNTKSVQHSPRVIRLARGQAPQERSGRRLTSVSNCFCSVYARQAGGSLGPRRRTSKDPITLLF